jgi:hypothetical protein
VNVKKTQTNPDITLVDDEDEDSTPVIGYPCKLLPLRALPRNRCSAATLGYPTPLIGYRVVSKPLETEVEEILELPETRRCMKG